MLITKWVGQWEPAADEPKMILLKECCAYTIISSVRVVHGNTCVILYICTIFSQTLPDGKPDTLSPSLDKKDIPRLKKDVPKYGETGMLTGDKLSRWETLLEDLNNSSAPLRTSQIGYLIGTLQSVREFIQFISVSKYLKLF